MAIIIEDGSLVVDANSYATIADLVEYAELRNLTLPVSDAEREVLLIKAMDYIYSTCGQTWQGCRVSETQALDFPREGVWVDGVLVAKTAIPRNLLYGQLAAAVEANTTDLQPNQSAKIKRQRVEGAVEIEYFNPGKVQSISAFAKADALLKALCSHNSLFLIRA